MVSLGQKRQREHDTDRNRRVMTGRLVAGCRHAPRSGCSTTQHVNAFEKGPSNPPRQRQTELIPMITMKGALQYSAPFVHDKCLSRGLDCRNGAHQTDRRETLYFMLDIYFQIASLAKNETSEKPGRVGAVDCGGARLLLDCFDLPPESPWCLLLHLPSGGLLLALDPQWPGQKRQLRFASRGK
jgi:hypothetical protein